MGKIFSVTALVIGSAVSFAPAGVMGATFSFSDDFSPPSAAWSNSTGNWTASGGKYYAQQPNNNPEAISFLPFVFTNASDQVTVTINSLGDGGILFEAPSKTNYLLSVLGGAGYGQGLRGGTAGNSAYWATYANPSATFNLVSPAFNPGSTYTVTIAVVNGLFTLYNDPSGTFDGSSVPLTSYDDPGLSKFQLGLYDDQPNTTTGSGFGPAQSFSTFSVAGTVPESSTWAMLLLGFAGLGFAGYRSRRWEASGAARA